MPRHDDEPNVTFPTDQAIIDCSRDLTIEWDKNKTKVEQWWLFVADVDHYKNGRGTWNIRNEKDMKGETKEMINAGQLKNAGKIYVQVMGKIKSKDKEDGPIEEYVLSPVVEYYCGSAKT